MDMEIYFPGGKRVYADYRRVHDPDGPAGPGWRRRVRARAVRPVPRFHRHLRGHLRPRLHAAARHRP